ncbi:acetyltransferase [Campylobacter coli]|nr:acetyltransferase [Campylobacter coli]
MKYFLEHNGKKYSDKDLIDAFYQLGIKRGDILCVHTELMKFGIPLLSRNEFLQTILNCFFEVIGQEGTLIMPTFTYSFCKNEVYDKVHSKGKVGVLNEFFRTSGGGVRRTSDPIFSFAVKGAKADIFLKENSSCFGKDSVYEILTREGGKFMLLGLNYGHALTHYAEERNTSFCRYFKEFKGFVIDELGQKREKRINYYVRDLEKAYVCSLDKINEIVRQTRYYKSIKFAGDFLESYDAKEYVKAIGNALKQDKFAIYEKLLL